MTPTLRSPAFADASDLPARLRQGLSKLGIALKSDALRDDDPHGLPPIEAQILVLLRLRASAGTRLAEIAEGLGIDDAAASDATLRLAGRGLVRKPERAFAGDLVFALTDEGRARARRAFTLAEELLESIDALPPREQEHLYRTVLRAIQSMQARGRIEPARTCVTCTNFRPYVHADEERPHHCALVNAPLGDRHLRVDCPDHAPAATDDAARTWERR
jgi:DNA-binding MarR family transcriptional regulator